VNCVRVLLAGPHGLPGLLLIQPETGNENGEKTESVLECLESMDQSEIKDTLQSIADDVVSGILVSRLEDLLVRALVHKAVGTRRPSVDAELVAITSDEVVWLNLREERVASLRAVTNVSPVDAERVSVSLGPRETPITIRVTAFEEHVLTEFLERLADAITQLTAAPPDPEPESLPAEEEEVRSEPEPEPEEPEEDLNEVLERRKGVDFVVSQLQGANMGGDIDNAHPYVELKGADVNDVFHNRDFTTAQGASGCGVYPCGPRGLTVVLDLVGQQHVSVIVVECSRPGTLHAPPDDAKVQVEAKVQTEQSSMGEWVTIFPMQDLVSLVPRSQRFSLQLESKEGAPAEPIPPHKAWLKLQCDMDTETQAEKIRLTFTVPTKHNNCGIHGVQLYGAKEAVIEQHVEVVQDAAHTPDRGSSASVSNQHELEEEHHPTVNSTPTDTEQVHGRRSSDARASVSGSLGVAPSRDATPRTDDVPHEQQPDVAPPAVDDTPSMEERPG